MGYLPAKRPNAIGLSTVKLLGVENNIIHIEMVDMLNETPLIVIKPFFSKFSIAQILNQGG